MFVLCFLNIVTGVKVFEAIICSGDQFSILPVINVWTSETLNNYIF